MNCSTLAKFVAGPALILAFLVGCAAPPTPNQQTLPPTLSAAQLEATSGAIAQATRRAQATLDTQATADSRAVTATAKAEAATQTAAQATATAETQAAAQAIIAAQSSWPSLIAEPFTDNRLGWPVGIKQDNSLIVTSEVTDGKYLWTVKVKHGNSYFNLMPADGPALTDFYAAVTLQFIRGDEGGDYAYGLVFRHIDDDYGFFGLQNDGRFRVLVVYDTGIYQFIQESSSAINTGPGETNQIAVRAIGSDFIFLINDQAVWQLTEDMAPGDIGLGVDVVSKQDEAQVEFTGFEVHAP